MLGNKQSTTDTEPQIKGGLPACILDAQLFEALWAILSSDGDFLWQAEVGTGGDLLGKQEERPRQIVDSWQQLIGLLESLPRIDSLTITAEVTGKGVIALAFRNFAPANGKLVVYSQDGQWAQARYASITEMFAARQERVASWMHSRIGFGMVQTAIPLSLSCLVVVLTAALLIPLEVRRTEWLWWITAATTIITLRLAYTVSDKMIIYAIKKYPYIHFS